MAHLILRTLLVAAAAVGAITGTVACSGSTGTSQLSKSDVANRIAAKMTDPAGGKPDSVTCPADLPERVGAQLNCEMKVKDQKFIVNATVTSVSGGNTELEIVRTVDKGQVAQAISDRRTLQVGHRPESVTCPDNLKGTEGATLRCEAIDKGLKHAVYVTVTNVHAGTVSFDFRVDDHPE
jgi:Domain of unknown function (DUF4333)